MGSVVSDRAVPLQGIYAASKHAIKAYTDTLRMELEHDGVPVAVTLIKPGAIDTPYYQHAKNYMSEEPAPPPPVYSADTVARAVCECAERPVRDITIGGGGRMIATMGALAPRLTDLVMERTMFGQQKSGRPNDHRDSLHTTSAQRGGIRWLRGSRDAVERLHARDAVGRRTRAAIPRARGGGGRRSDGGAAALRGQGARALRPGSALSSATVRCGAGAEVPRPDTSPHDQHDLADVLPRFEHRVRLRRALERERGVDHRPEFTAFETRPHVLRGAPARWRPSARACAAAASSR